MEEIRQAQIYGVRPSRTFEQAAAKFVIENQHKRSIEDDAGRLKGLMPWIGQVPLDKVHMGACSLGSRIAAKLVFRLARLIMVSRLFAGSQIWRQLNGSMKTA